jgi:hypothetical protein
MDLPMQNNSAGPEKPVLNHQELENLVATGAKHILDGAIQFPAWAQLMLQDVGELVRWIAERTHQTPDAALRQIYYYAVPGAKLLQEGRRLAASSWVQQYAVTVGKQLGWEKKDPYDAPTSGKVDGFLELFKHPAAHHDSPWLFVGLGVFVAAFLYFLITDPAAFLNNRLAILSLIPVAFLAFLGVVLAYVWVRKKIRSLGRKRIT